MSEENQELQKPEAEAALPDVKDKKAIILDDDPGCVELIKTLLEKVGMTVKTASDGKQGLVLLKEELPDVLILDVLMPEMDGFHFFKELKKTTGAEQLPVVITTVRKNMEDSFLALGADAFAPKPIDSTTLLKTVTKLATRPVKTTEEKTDEENKKDS